MLLQREQRARRRAALCIFRDKFPGSSAGDHAATPCFRWVVWPLNTNCCPRSEKFPLLPVHTSDESAVPVSERQQTETSRSLARRPPAVFQEASLLHNTKSDSTCSVSGFTCCLRRFTGCHRAPCWTGKVATLPESSTEATLLFLNTFTITGTHVELQPTNVSC